jgi:hypothetical protein
MPTVSIKPDAGIPLPETPALKYKRSVVAATQFEPARNRCGPALSRKGWISVRHKNRHLIESPLES